MIAYSVSEDGRRLLLLEALGEESFEGELGEEAAQVVEDARLLGDAFGVERVSVVGPGGLVVCVVAGGGVEA